jgi:hypothetical protein
MAKKPTKAKASKVKVQDLKPRKDPKGGMLAPRRRLQ